MENDLSLQVARVDWRLDALDTWRSDADGRIAVLESKVNDLRFTDEVAAKLAERLSARRRLELTFLQKVGAGAFAVMLVVAPTVIAKVAG